MLHLIDVPRVDVKGTPPVVFAIACTTAEFDAPEGQGLGEALMARPRGPIAYYGATRVCHPAANTFLGRALAHAMFRDPGTPRRLGDVLGDARDAVLDPARRPTVDIVALAARQMLPPGTGVTLERLEREAFWLYNLLGDPATLLPIPEPVPALAVKVEGGAVEVEAKGLPDGAKVTFTLEVPRGRVNPLRPLAPVANPGDPAAAGDDPCEPRGRERQGGGAHGGDRRAGPCTRAADATGRGEAAERSRFRRRVHRQGVGRGPGTRAARRPRGEPHRDRLPRRRRALSRYLRGCAWRRRSMRRSISAFRGPPWST